MKLQLSAFTRFKFLHVYFFIVELCLVAAYFHGGKALDLGKS